MCTVRYAHIYIAVVLNHDIEKNRITVRYQQVMKL